MKQLTIAEKLCTNICEDSGLQVKVEKKKRQRKRTGGARSPRRSPAGAGAARARRERGRSPALGAGGGTGAPGLLLHHGSAAIIHQNLHRSLLPFIGCCQGELSILAWCEEAKLVVFFSFSPFFFCFVLRLFFFVWFVFSVCGFVS